MRKLYVDSITLSRVILGLFFFYYVVFDLNTICLLIIFTLTALSDIIDGKLARKYNLATSNGGKLDVICDFIFIMLSTSALVLIDLIPVWYVLIIVLKMIEFFKTSDKSLRYDKFGHIVALMFYAFPIVAVLIANKNYNSLLAVFISVCAIISSALRIKVIK